MADYYILSTKCSIHQRKTKKHGTVYDVMFRLITKDGEEIQKKLSGYSSKAKAKQAHADFILENCELVKNNPVKKKETAKKDPLIGDLLREYIASLSNQNKDSSIYVKTKIYESFIFPKYGDRKITDLTKEELYRWQDELWSTKNPRTGKAYSHNYLNKVRNFFAAFLSWCESRYGYENQLSEVKRPKKRAPSKEKQIWTKEEFQKFISVVDDPMYYTLFTLLFFTGRRKGEVLALTPQDIKLNSPQPSINFSKSITRKTIDGSAYKITSTKADKIQTTPICKTVRYALQNYEAGVPFFFGGEKPIAENTLTRVFQRYCNKAEMSPIRIHDLRHSFVSMLIHNGANFMVVADLIGDTVEQVTKTYAHMYQSDKIAIINTLD